MQQNLSELNRICRDAQDVGATIKALAARKIEVIVLQLGTLDLISSAGKLMLEMLAAVAEMERDLLVERTQSGLAMANTASRALGRPSNSSTEQRMVITADYAAGVSVSELARRFTVSRANVFSIVKPLN